MIFVGLLWLCDETLELDMDEVSVVHVGQQIINCMLMNNELRNVFLLQWFLNTPLCTLLSNC